MMSSSAADADDALLIKTGVEVHLLPVAIYGGFANLVSVKKEEKITAGGLYPWTISIAITMATCARNCSCYRRQRMHSSTGSTPFAVSQIMQRNAIEVQV